MGKKIYITESQLDYIIKNVDLLNEQEQPAQGGDCASLIFKGTQLTIENFGKILNCFQKGAGTGKKFWDSKSDNEKKYVLDSIVQSYGNDLQKHGLATKEFNNNPNQPNGYVINTADWNSSIKRGDKKGTGGLYLNESNQIYLVNGGAIGLQKGFNNYGDFVNKLNEYNRNAFISKKPPVSMSFQPKTTKGVEGVYKNFAYKLNLSTASDGVLFYLPTSDAKLQKVGIKVGKPEKTPVPQITFGNQDQPFADDETRLRDELYNQIAQDLQSKLSDTDIKIDSITIQSSASNLSSKYIGDNKKGATSNYQNNQVLAKDRGEMLYQRLQKQFGKNLPQLKDGKVEFRVQPCSKLLNDGRCDQATDKADPSQKYVKIIYNGIQTKPTFEDETTNKGSYTYTQWQLKKF